MDGAGAKRPLGTDVSRGRKKYTVLCSYSAWGAGLFGSFAERSSRGIEEHGRCQRARSVSVLGLASPALNELPQAQATDGREEESNRARFRNW